jgi:betaine reductase
MTRGASILGASLVLAHVPDLVRYGSKPAREPARARDLSSALRSFDQAVGYAPNQVFIGNLRPEQLWDRPRPWWSSSEAGPGAPIGPFGEIVEQAAFYELMAEIDGFDLIRLKQEPRPRAGDLTLYQGEEVVGSFAGAHESDEALSASVLLENLSCKASAVQALRRLLPMTGVLPERVDYVIGAGEEAIGDRYQRGGGNLAKAAAESAGLTSASGGDVKAFCAGPVHALVMAAALIDSGVCEHVVVVAGGSLAKLGMKFLGALDHGVPILEDVLAGTAVLLGPAATGQPVLRLDAVGRHPTGAGSSQQALLESIVGKPLDAMGRHVRDIDRYATELHNPDITQAAGGGDVPERNYRMLGGLATIRGELERDDIDGFVRGHGLPGFSPTQGHIASAIPWLPHALDRFATGELTTTMLFAKGSLFLGRMTRLWDGASITLEVM